MAHDADLFGRPTAPAQASLFGDGENQMTAPAQAFAPDPEIIRQRLKALLAKAKGAATMPWSERDARMWQTVFPNMANWLPLEEADQLRLDFASEIKRLSAAS